MIEKLKSIVTACTVRLSPKPENTRRNRFSGYLASGSQKRVAGRIRLTRAWSGKSVSDRLYRPPETDFAKPSSSKVGIGWQLYVFCGVQMRHENLFQSR